jgi:hypothetical protein
VTVVSPSEVQGLVRVAAVLVERLGAVGSVPVVELGWVASELQATADRIVAALAELGQRVSFE